MTESQYIAELNSRWPAALVASSMEVLALADNAIREHPTPAQLWYLRGFLVWMAPEECLYDEIDALISYEKAVELDPGHADAYDRIGDYYDGLKNDPVRAMTYCEKAAQIRGVPLG